MNLTCLICTKTFDGGLHAVYCSPECRIQGTDRPCQRCGEQIPLWKNIDGQKRNLKNRTKCLSCLPFRGPKILTPEQRLKNNKIKCAKYYDENKEIQKQKSSKRTAEVREDKKQEIIDLIGGCQVCSYNKLARNLSFHHLGDKKFNISGTVFSFGNKTLYDELIKCVCLCHLCHGEAHEGLIDENSFIGLNKQFIKVLDTWLTTTSFRSRRKVRKIKSHM